MTAGKELARNMFGVSAIWFPFISSLIIFEMCQDTVISMIGAVIFMMMSVPVIRVTLLRRDFYTEMAPAPIENRVDPRLRKKINRAWR